MWLNHTFTTQEPQSSFFHFLSYLILILAYLINLNRISGSTQASSGKMVVPMKKTKSEVIKSKTNMSKIDVDKLAQKLNMMS